MARSKKNHSRSKFSQGADLPFRALSGPPCIARVTARLSQRCPPSLRAMGFLVSQHGQLGAIPPPPFSERSPLGEHEKWRCDTPPPHKKKRGISAILARYPMKTRQMGAIPPSAILSRKGIARYGGVSRTGPLSSRVLFSFLPPLLATPLPPLFSAPFRPFLPLEKCSVL